MEAVYTLTTLLMGCTIIYKSSQTQDITTGTKGFSHKLNCFGPKITHPPENITSILWSKVREEILKDKIFEFEFDTQQIYYYKKALKQRIEFDKKDPLFLSLRNSKMEDSGLYECFLKYSENGKGSSYTNYIYLNVPHPPTAIYIEDKKGTVIEGVNLNREVGEKIKLTCTVLNGFPSPEVQWNLDDEVIRGTIRKQIDIRNITPTKISSTINAFTAQPELSGGKLTCKALQRSGNNQDKPIVKQRSVILKIRNESNTSPGGDLHLTSKSTRAVDTEKRPNVFNIYSTMKPKLPSTNIHQSSNVSNAENYTGNIKELTVSRTHQRKNYSYASNVERTGPTSSTLRNLLLEITKNIFVVSVLFIIIIILLICLYAINQCEKQVRHFSDNQIMETQRSDNSETEIEAGSSYQATSRIIY